MTCPTRTIRSIIGGYNPDDPTTTAEWGLTDKAGRFVHVETVAGQQVLKPGVQVLAGLSSYQGQALTIPALADGTIHLGVQATDLSGTRGPIAEFQYILDTTPPTALPLPDLQAATDSGVSKTDNITNFNNAGGRSPVFDVSPLLIGMGLDAADVPVTIELWRAL